MPTYTFRNTETEEVFDKIMSWNQRQEYLAENPKLEPVIGAPGLADPVRVGVTRHDDGFREVLSKIHNANPKSNLGDKLSRK